MLLHCPRVCVSMLVFLFGPITYQKFWMNIFKYFTMMECPCRRVLQQTMSKSHENEHEGLLPDYRAGVKESESEDDLSWMHWQNARQLSELWYESDDCVTRQVTSDPGDRQTAGCTLASGARLEWPLILLLAHGLTVKLSPCWIGACLCGHFKCNLLLAHARPRMIQHLSSQ